MVCGQYLLKPGQGASIFELKCRIPPFVACTHSKDQSGPAAFIKRLARDLQQLWCFSRRQQWPGLIGNLSDMSMRSFSAYKIRFNILSYSMQTTAAELLAVMS